MSENKITYKDVEEYENLFSLAPSFLLERFAKRNTNLVLKFKSTIKTQLDDLTDDQRNKLDIILNTDVSELQSIMDEAYQHNNKKTYKILADPKYKQFIEDNLREVHNLLDKK